MRGIFFRKKFQLRILIALPLILTLLVFSISLFNLGFLREFNRLIRGLNAGDSLSMYNYQELLKTFYTYQTLILVYAAAIGTLLAWALIFPLRKLTHAFGRISQKDFTLKASTEQEKEIAETFLSFNQMIASLNNYILESISSGILALDKNEKIVSINSAASSILGIKEDIFLKPLTYLIPQNAYNNNFYTIIEGALKQTKTGSSLEARVQTRRGHVVDIGLTTSLLRSKDETLLGVILNFREIGELKEEVRRHELMEKLTTLGKLSAGIVHEIRNPLGSIQGLLKLIQEEISPEDKKYKYLEVIMKEIGRINIVASDLFTFIPKEGALKFLPIDVNSVIEEAISLAHFSLTEKQVAIEKDYGDLPRLEGEPSLLKQLFLNLILNAFSAIEKDGTISILTRRDDGFITVGIKDTGCGMSKEDLDKIFEPFFTTRGGGIGLGLSVASQIVNAHRGRIEVESELGKGSQFLIHLPISQGMSTEEDTHEEDTSA